MLSTPYNEWYYAEYYNAEYCYAEHWYVEYCYAEFCYTECHYAECNLCCVLYAVYFMQSVVYVVCCILAIIVYAE